MVSFPDVVGAASGDFIMRIAKCRGRVVLVFAGRTKLPSLASASILLPKPTVMEAGR